MKGNGLLRIDNEEPFLILELKVDNSSLFILD
jgi:hypothetical protein